MNSDAFHHHGGALRHRKANAKIMLRWAVQHGNVVIPTSVHKERIAMFDFSLTEENMAALDALNANWSVIFG